MLHGASPSLYLSDSAALRAAGAYNWAFCTEDTQCMLIQRLADDDMAPVSQLLMNGSADQHMRSVPPTSGADRFTSRLIG